MTKKDYEAAARIVQRISNAHDVYAVKDAFAELFRNDNPKFDEARFRRACVPGANVKARS